MAKKAESQKWIQTMVDKLNELGPYMAADWGGAVQLVFPDLGTGWLIKFAMDGTVESWDEKIDEEAASGVVEMDSDIFIGIMDKSLVPMELFSSGKVTTRKSMEALVKVFPAIM